MPQVKNIGIHPIKALDRISVESARITDGGIVEHDRKFALYDHEQEQPINGIKRDEVHNLTASFSDNFNVVTLETDEGNIQEFNLAEDQQAAAEWFSRFFDTPISIQQDEANGFVSRPEAGPSVISTATLREVASWFDDLTVPELRRRLRVNIEIEGVPAFWEDRFVGDSDESFQVGDVQFVGVEPCGRCVIPQRNPDSGELTQGFRSTFIKNRKRTFPEWADVEAFDHFFYLMLIADVPSEFRGRKITVGDELVAMSGDATEIEGTTRPESSST